MLVSGLTFSMNFPVYLYFKISYVIHIILYALSDIWGNSSTYTDLHVQVGPTATSTSIKLYIVFYIYQEKLFSTLSTCLLLYDLLLFTTCPCMDLQIK